MITAVTLALSFAFEPGEAKVMDRPPRPPSEPLLSLFLVWRIVFVSLILTVGTFGIFLWARLHEMPIEQARTIAVNTLVMFEIFYLFNTRYLRESVLSRQGLFGNPTALLAIASVLVFQLLFTYVSLFQRLFGTAAISLTSWLQITAIASAVFVLVEVEKLLLRRWEIRRKLVADPLAKEIQLNYPARHNKT